MYYNNRVDTPNTINTVVRSSTNQDWSICTPVVWDPPTIYTTRKACPVIIQPQITGVLWEKSSYDSRCRLTVTSKTDFHGRFKVNERAQLSRYFLWEVTNVNSIGFQNIE